ncbi:sugar phosphate isomerase/epimerase family protein [Metabacillus niabensis]|uniref:sugar phosphate isomerase/epimerase family protein n=1 Tax=Metabacillus niabensis TaxID=324854 RepID=UPI001CFB8C39|nr:sugar phosphate isomerase/epimerase family protein [Metabacillus niabensis]
MLKGINQWCYPEGTPLEQVFEYSLDAGFDAVELNVYDAGGIGLTMETTEEEAKQIVKLADTYDLKVKSLSTSLLWKCPLSHPDGAIREQGRKVVEKQIQLAAVMEIDTVLVVPGVVTETITYSECYDRSQIELRKLLPLAEKNNVTIGIENVWNKFLLSPLEMVNYIDELNSDYAGAYFDVGNVLQFGYPEQWIRMLGHRIKRIHVKDFNTSVGNITGFVPLLAGDVNWRNVIEALKEIDYNDTITAEITPYKLDPRPLAVDTSRNMEFIFNLQESVTS